MLSLLSATPDLNQRTTPLSRLIGQVMETEDYSSQDLTGFWTCTCDDTLKDSEILLTYQKQAKNDNKNDLINHYLKTRSVFFNSRLSVMQCCKNLLKINI